MFLADPFVSLYRHRAVVMRTTVNEVRFRYAGSVLGLFWLLIAPLLLMVIYAGVYLVIFRIRPADLSPAHYVLYVLSGLIPFLGFSDALTLGSGSLSSNKSLLLSTVFPAELVPLRAVLSSQAPTAIGLLLCVAIAFGLGTTSAALLLLPFIWLNLVLFVVGVTWVLSLASLVVRDIQQILGFLTMALLIVSPIAYTLSMVPPALRPVLSLNPLTHFIGAMQDVIVFSRSPSVGTWLTILGLGVTSFTVGFWVFQRAKRVFFDYA